ncbi:putative ribonuclease H-like domain-containing protein [Tanacetum coccineum]
MYDRFMTPLAAQLERKPRRDRGTRRGHHSTSSSTFDQPSSSYLNNDDDDNGNDQGTSRTSTPSPIGYVNSLTNQEELLQFKLQEVWTLVDLPNGKRAIGTKWVFRNKKDDRGIVIRNKARLIAQGCIQKEEIDYDDVFSPVTRIEVIRLFLAYDSFKDFMVYQMDVKSAFLFGKIAEEVYVCQPPGFEDTFLIEYTRTMGFKEGELTRPYSSKDTKIEALQEELLQFKLQEVWTLMDLPNGKRGCIQEEGIDYDEVFAPVSRIEAIRLFLAYASFNDFVVYQMDVKSDILYGKIAEEVYVCQPPGFEDTFLIEYTRTMGFKEGELTRPYSSKDTKKFGFTEVKTASTPMETQKPMLKDENGEEVDVHMYRSMIGSLMYLSSSRPDIMFAVCVCARYQVNPKVSHFHVVKRIFRYLKGQPKLGLWYPKDSPFDLVAYTDSDYAGASLDRKSTT